MPTGITGVVVQLLPFSHYHIQADYHVAGRWCCMYDKDLTRDDQPRQPGEPAPAIVMPENAPPLDHTAGLQRSCGAYSRTLQMLWARCCSTHRNNREMESSMRQNIPDRHRL